MNDVDVIIDTSGSMHIGGKIAIIDNTLRTISCQENFNIHKIQWDGDESLVGLISDKPILLLTDGYSLKDISLNNKEFKSFLNQHITLQKIFFWIVLCGADAYNVGKSIFPAAKVVNSGNVLYALESMLKE